MKKLLVCLLVLTLLVPSALAESFDLSSMSFDELVALRERVNLAMWQSDDWQEVTVPQGLWKVGEDIPAGHWTISAADGAFTSVEYGDVLTKGVDGISYKSSVYVSTYLTSPSRSTFNENTDRAVVDIDMKDGFYVVILGGSAVFTPYTGKPDLGFK